MIKFNINIGEVNNITSPFIFEKKEEYKNWLGQYIGQVYI
jgi:hypothetical protein